LPPRSGKGSRVPEVFVVSSGDGVRSEKRCRAGVDEKPFGLGEGGVRKARRETEKRSEESKPEGCFWKRKWEGARRSSEGKTVPGVDTKVVRGAGEGKLRGKKSGSKDRTKKIVLGG